MKAGKITDRDKGYKSLIKRVGESAAKQTVSVGVHSDDDGAHSEGVTILDVANFNEFGTANIPERSFIRAWHDESLSENQATLSKLSEQVVKGTIPTLEKALDMFGARAAGEVKKRIIAGIPPENADSTIAKKGTSTPLIGETTQLLNSITWKVNGE